MATLIFDEQWEDITSNNQAASVLGSRGWFDGYNDGWGTGQHIVRDDTLGQYVFRQTWSNRKSGMPDGNPSTMRKAINQSLTANGVTLYSLIRFHRWFDGSGGGNSHTPLRFGVGDYWGSNSPGTTSVPGDVILETHRDGHGLVSYPSNASDPDHNWYVSTQFTSGSANPYSSDDDLYIQHPTAGNYLRDDVWYEAVMFYDNDNGGSNGRVAVWWREYGQESWTLAFEYDNIALCNIRGSVSQFHTGSYLHSNSTNEQVYVDVARITVYGGDAMADGDLGDIDNGGDNGGGEPVDPLEITDFTVRTTTTSAVLTWKTNKDANTIVDYGSTDARGTIVRGADNTQDHTVELTGLTPNTTYYYRYSSKSADGDVVFDENNSTFVTREESDTTGPVISDIKTSASTTETFITWTTDEASSSSVDYGETTRYGDSEVGEGNTTKHEVTLTGLTEGTTYHYRVKSSDANKNETTSADATFVTQKSETEPVSLGDLVDVSLSNTTDGQVLVRKGDVWVNGNITVIVEDAVKAALKNAKISLS